MKKHHMKKVKEGSVAEEAMESPAEEAAEGGMKRGGKAKKKHMKVEGHKAKARMDKPARKASGGAISRPSAPDTDDAGVSPSSPFAMGSPQRKRGGKC